MQIMRVFNESSASRIIFIAPYIVMHETLKHKKECKFFVRSVMINFHMHKIVALQYCVFLATQTKL